MINSHNLNEDVGDYIFKDACLEHYANPLYFNSVKKKFEETLEFVETEPAIEVKNWDIITLWLSYLIVDNEKLATFIDEFIDRTDEIYDADESRYLFTFPSYLGLEMVFYVITCGYDRSYKYRFDFSNIFIIKKDLIEDSNSLLVHQNSKLAQHFEDYIEEDFKKCRDINLKKCETKLYDNFEVTTFRNSDDNKTWHIFDVLNKKSEKISDYNHEDLYEIASQKPLSKEFLQLISSLNFDIDFAYRIKNTVEDSDEVLYWINKKILEDMNYSRNILSADELLNKLDGLYTKTILKFKENKWDEIKESLISKISSEEIKSSYDLQFNFSQMLHSSFKINILNAQIEAILDFKELDYSYSEKLAFYLRDFDILDNGLCEYLNDLIPEKVEIIQKEYLDKAKFAAPKWLVYPELSATTIGWRMGYGEVYAINEPWPNEEFRELFPRPKNWVNKKSDFKRHPILGSFWCDQGEQKYFEVTEDAIEVNDFITIEQEDEEFRYNSKTFNSIEHAILTVKYDFFDKIDYYNTTFNTLKRGFDLTEKEIEYWQNFKYSVLLNTAYYKFMQDENLKEKLLQTADKSLIYISDDEWGGDENLFGFALMELRDEIRRLYKNEDRIDWEYTEYLKHKNPY